MKKEDPEFALREVLDGLSSTFGIGETEIESLKTSVEKGDHDRQTTVFSVNLTDQRPPCPHCGEPDPRIHGHRQKHINYSIICGRNTELRLDLRRYKCRHCGKTYSEYDPFTVHKGRIPPEMVTNILNDLHSAEETYTSVGRRYNTSATTVTNLFDTRVNPERLPLSEYICMDENYAFRSDRSKYVCVLIDYLSQEAIDILPNRFKKDLINYFKSIPIEERKRVKAVGIDMYPTYRDVVYECFPKTTRVCVDRYHLVAEFVRQADAIRMRVQNKARNRTNDLKKRIAKMKAADNFQSQSVQEEYRIAKAELEEASHIYYVIRKFRWIIYKSPNDPCFDINRKRGYNQHFKREMNYYDFKQCLLSLSPSLSEVCALRGMLTDLYDYQSPREGHEFMNSMIKEFETSSFDEMKHFGRTLNKWRREILNSLIVVEKFDEVQKDGSVKSRNRRLHNGVIERKNKTIKILKNTANGFTNFKRFRARVLYVLRAQPSFSLDPAYPSKRSRMKKKTDY